MPTIDRRSHRVSHNRRRPKQKPVTVNDLLTKDDINGILNHLDTVKPHITAAIVIYMDKRDNKYHWQITEDTLVSLATWMLESIKLELLNADDED